METCSKNWVSGIEFIESLKKIADKEYIESTSNYRNLSHHRFPPGLECGVTNRINRAGYKEEVFKYTTIENGVNVLKQKDIKGVHYNFGGIPPLKSSNLIPVFKKQFNLLTNALEAYSSLVVEHYSYGKEDNEGLIPFL